MVETRMPRLHLALAVIAASLLLAGTNPLLGQTDSPAGDTDSAKKKVTPRVGVIYEMDYSWPDRGFTNPNGSDALHQHFRVPRKVNGEDDAWHENQLDQMMESDIDLVLARFDGRNEPREAKQVAALVRAFHRIVAAGGTPPRIALYFDTTDLLKTRAGKVADLTKPAVQKDLQDRVLRFYSLVPASARFTLDGFLPVLLGPTYGARHGREVLEVLSDRVQSKEKQRLFVVAERSWRARAAAVWQREAALIGPGSDTAVKVIGPGYNDTKIPGRGTPIRDREKTRWYRHSWNRALLSLPTVVLIDSWNDFRQGTGIAPSVEYGDQYVALTRRFAKRLRARLLPDVQRPVRLVHPDPLPRPDTGWWKPDPKLMEASFVAGRDPKALGTALRLASQDDGPFERRNLGERNVLVSPGPGDRYLYFGIADEFANRASQAFAVEISFVDGGRGRVELQYDSWDPRASLDGAYKSAPHHTRGPNTTIRTIRWTLFDARFSNRQNGGCDLRLKMKGDIFELLSVKVIKLEEPADRKKKPTVEIR